jgi:uncharacterized protein (DUF1778 family)
MNDFITIKVKRETHKMLKYISALDGKNLTDTVDALVLKAHNKKQRRIEKYIIENIAAKHNK